MRFIHPAPQYLLDQLQEMLSANSEPGIVDLWVDDSPVSRPYYIVAEDAGLAVGVASLNWGVELCELYKLYVAPSSKRTGIGTALVDKVLEILRERNVKTLAIEMAEGSFPFWQKFAETHPLEPFYDNKYFYQLT